MWDPQNGTPSWKTSFLEKDDSFNPLNPLDSYDLTLIDCKSNYYVKN